MIEETNFPSLGQIITFYSYKGGTGRSMALANVACLLAQKWINNDEKVLMIDWDLEAPGLHQFFRDRFQGVKNHDLPKNQLGLIDWFYALKSRIADLSLDDDSIDESLFESLDFQKFHLETETASLFLMPAGKSDDGLYSTRVNSFIWDDFFTRFPSLFQKFANYLRKKFKYILIDSRTGYTDISGICTSIMPEKLVAVFTPNRQSLNGILELVRKAVDYRKQSDDLQPLVVFPLASRIDNAETDLQNDWRFGNQAKDIIGYQPQFESILKEIYNLPKCDLTAYFDEVQLQYVPRYSYGEDISVLSERTEDRLKLAHSYENCAQKLIEFEHPWGVVDEVLPLLEATTELNDTRDKYRQLRVFLCHASSDKSLARQLNKKMREEGWIDPWLDEEKLLPGQDWEKEIEKAVGASNAVIVCLSESSVSKEGYVQRELKRILDIAIEKPEESIFIVPLRLDDCQVPNRLSAWHYVDYFPEGRREQTYDRLINSLQARANVLGINTTFEESPKTKSGVKAYLLGRRGEYAGKKFLISQNLITLGRSSNNIIRLRDVSISRIHASVIRTKRGVYIRDEGSSVGTYLNGKPLPTSSPVLLRDGDRVRLGKAEEFEFKAK